MKKTILLLLAVWIILSLASKYDLYIASGLSMYPHIDEKNILIIEKRGIPERGDVVVYKNGGLTQVKRAICMPGDTVLIGPGILKCGDITIEDTRVHPPLGNQYGPYLIPKKGDQIVNEHVSHSVYNHITEDDRGEGQPVIASQDFLFVVGDNYSVSVDSRHSGVIPLEDVLGKVVHVW